MGLYIYPYVVSKYLSISDGRFAELGSNIVHGSLNSFSFDVGIGAAETRIPFQVSGFKEIGLNYALVVKQRNS